MKETSTQRTIERPFVGHACNEIRGLKQKISHPNAVWRIQKKANIVNSLSENRQFGSTQFFCENRISRSVCLNLVDEGLVVVFTKPLEPGVPDELVQRCCSWRGAITALNSERKFLLHVANPTPRSLRLRCVTD